MNLLCVIIAPLAKCNTTGAPPPPELHLCRHHPSPGIIIAGMLSFLKMVNPFNSVVGSWMSAQHAPPQQAEWRTSVPSVIRGMNNTAEERGEVTGEKRWNDTEGAGVDQPTTN